jgi:hypothetical protein
MGRTLLSYRHDDIDTVDTKDGTRDEDIQVLAYAFRKCS